MLALLSDPAIWASFITLTILEIVLGVDNVIFISIISSRVRAEDRRRAQSIGLIGALVLRLVLLLGIAVIAQMEEPVIHVAGFGLSWRDILMLLGGLFLLYKASTEIFAEVEGLHNQTENKSALGMTSAIIQIMLLNIVFSIDSIITAIGIADVVAVMAAAIIISTVVMIAASDPIANFIHKHPSTKMLALSFLVMVGMAPIADGFHHHIERGFIYAAMVFGGGVEALNLARKSRAIARMAEQDENSQDEP
ncbi:MAG: TerC family protein [Rhodobacteraceae bacterium]|nr:TerC family protein [Paracoccaceae bacterium]